MSSNHSHIGQRELYVTSGHYAKYGADSFQPITTHMKEKSFTKTDELPSSCEIYNVRPWSYKDLQKVRWIWYCLQIRAKRWITRTDSRGIYSRWCTYILYSEQLDEEFKSNWPSTYVFGSLGFENFTAQISLRDKENKEKYIGSDENWEKAERYYAAADKGLSTVIEYGEAAFYGPKLDFMVKML
jgi:threonyl-tRNA synthetase